MSVGAGKEPVAPPGESGEHLTGNYFVSTYPPFSVWDEAGAEAFRRALDRPATPGDGTPLGLYVHVPFCIDRCDYCYYLSHDDRSHEMPAYLEALEREATLYADRPALAGRRVSFAYFGGGTPSILSRRPLQALLRRVRESFSWTERPEVSFECAPRTVSAGKLRVLKEGGVTRVSLGVQQLDDAVLRENGRVHLVQDVDRAYGEIRRIGFDVVNVDLIVGLVGETEDTFHRSLERVVDMSPDCVTLYPLEIPNNTPLYRKLRGGAEGSSLPGWDVKRARLKAAFARLEAAGYVVRSAYALVRDPSRHRFVYQDAQYRGADLLGFGASSFSYLAGVHHQNLAGLASYGQALRGGALPLWRGHALTDEERLRREFLLQLKLGEAPLPVFRGKAGADSSEKFAATLSRFQARGWLSLEGDAVRMTREGLLQVDRLLPSFYLPGHQGIRYT